MVTTELPTLYQTAHTHHAYGLGLVPVTSNERSLELGAKIVAERTRQQKKQETKMAEPTLRVVQVFIADPNDNLPLKDRLIYQGEPQVTDLTDQELFYEIDIKALLDKHNEKRVATVNKKVKERTEHLDPARIRDLVMTVVTVASF